jgi:hypothetical protein
VVITDELAAILRKSGGASIDVVHRDIDRVRMIGPGADPDHSIVATRQQELVPHE